MRRAGFSGASDGLKNYATVQQDTSQWQALERSLTFLIGVVWLLVGAALPISDALIREGKHIKEINLVEILSIVQDSISIFGIIYIQLFIWWYIKKQKSENRSVTRSKHASLNSSATKTSTMTVDVELEEEEEKEKKKEEDDDDDGGFGKMKETKIDKAKVSNGDKPRSFTNGYFKHGKTDKKSPPVTLLNVVFEGPTSVYDESTTESSLHSSADSTGTGNSKPVPPPATPSAVEKPDESLGKLWLLSCIYEDGPPRTLDIGVLDSYGPAKKVTWENLNPPDPEPESQEKPEEVDLSMYEDGPPSRLPKVEEEPDADPNSSSKTSVISYEDEGPRRACPKPPPEPEPETELEPEPEDHSNDYEDGPAERLPSPKTSQTTVVSYEDEGPRRVTGAIRRPRNLPLQQSRASSSASGPPEDEAPSPKYEGLEEPGRVSKISIPDSLASGETPSDVNGKSSSYPDITTGDGLDGVGEYNPNQLELPDNDSASDSRKPSDASLTLVLGKDGFIKTADAEEEGDEEEEEESERGSSPSVIDRKKSKEEFRGFNTKLSNDSEGVNMFLRLGLIAFGAGVIVLDGIRSADVIRYKGKCDDYVKLLHYLTHLIVTVLQTIFLFQNHNIILNFHTMITRLVMMHLLIASISQWTKTVVHEVEEYMYNNIPKEKTYGSNYTDYYCKDTWTKVVAPYLFPCQVEFSLISAAIFFKILKTIGKILQETIKRRSQKKTEKYPKCHKSHKGILIGVVIVVSAITLVILSSVIISEKNKLLMMTVFTGVELGMLAIVLVLCLLAIKSTYNFHIKNSGGDNSVDRNLLVIGLAGIISYDLFTFIAACKNEDESFHTVTALMGSRAIVEILQACSQTLLITEASKRYVLHRKHADKKPGRGIIMVILMSNIGFWLINTFAAKQTSGKLHVYKTAFGLVSWTIVFNMCLPMIIFFRFHSTVCLSEVWSETFKQQWA